MGMEQEHHFVMVREKTFSQVKADLVHAFLSVSSTVFFCFLVDKCHSSMHSVCQGWIC